MQILLGPIPASIRAVVRQLIVESRFPREPDESLNRFLLTGGPTGCSYLNEQGDVWNWCAWDDSIEPVPDGPRKVGLIVIGAERVPELKEWLPKRPAEASDCQLCAGTGWLRLPSSKATILCMDCQGLGWLLV